MRNDVYTTKEMIVGSILALLIGLVIGLGAPLGKSDPVEVPQCQEDEIWRWAEDFDPPVKASDLVCVHLDTLSGE